MRLPIVRLPADAKEVRATRLFAICRKHLRWHRRIHGEAATPLVGHVSPGVGCGLCGRETLEEPVEVAWIAGSWASSDRFLPPRDD